MNDQVILAHLPLLRIEESTIPFASGCLWRMPFHAFDDYSLGAWSEQRKDYEATAPVFFKVQADAWEYTLNRAWIALSLAAPAAAFPNPWLSCIFGGVEKGEGFEQDFRMIEPHSTAQGDADLEFLFMAELAGAVRMLLAASSPPLTPAEQLTLSVIALEALLLPEVTSGVGLHVRPAFERPVGSQ